jgi:cell division septation protein DedD
VAPAQSEPAPAATQEANVAPTPAPAPATGGPRIQLAAVKSEAAAKAEWAKLQKAHPALLGGLTLTVEKVDKGASGVFYRIQAGPLADRAAAKQLCADLKARSQDCIVAK